eukprot:809936-Rhodomonas_salina.2
MSGTGRAYAPRYRPMRKLRDVRYPGTDLCCARRILLRTHYAISVTALGHHPTHLQKDEADELVKGRSRDPIVRRSVVWHGAVGLRPSYAMSGTEIGYAASRFAIVNVWRSISGRWSPLSAYARAVQCSVLGSVPS